MLMSTISVETRIELWILWSWSYMVLQASQHVYWGLHSCSVADQSVCTFDGWAIPPGPMLTVFTFMLGIQVQVSMLTQQALCIWGISSAFLIRAHFRCIWWEWCKPPMDNPSALHPVRIPRALRHTRFWLRRCFMAATAIKLAHSQYYTIAAAASHTGWRLTMGFSRFIELVISPWKGEGVLNSYSCFNRLTVSRLLGATWDK